MQSAVYEACPHVAFRPVRIVIERIQALEFERVAWELTEPGALRKLKRRVQKRRLARIARERRKCECLLRDEGVQKFSLFDVEE